MNEKSLQLYCRIQARLRILKERIALEETIGGEQGLSKIAVTVILVAVAVALVIAVVAVLGPAIMNLATRTGQQIESVPLDFGQ